jgi:hypothetical protein
MSYSANNPRKRETSNISTCLFVYLNGSSIAINPNNFSNQLVITNSTLGKDISRERLWSQNRASSAPTNSYIAHPIMFSATMTGPEIEKIEPYWSSPASSRALFEVIVGDIRGWTTTVAGEGKASIHLTDEVGGLWLGNSGSPEKLASELAYSSTPLPAMRSKREGRSFSEGRPKPSI